MTRHGARGGPQRGDQYLFLTKADADEFVAGLRNLEYHAWKQEGSTVLVFETPRQPRAVLDALRTHCASFGAVTLKEP